MTTKNADIGSATSPGRTKVKPAYWLEYGGRLRVTKLSRAPDRPLWMAGRVLESVGSLDGFALARRDLEGVRHVVASGVDFEAMARSHMPERTPEEAAAIDRHLAVIRAVGLREPLEDTDQRVY